MEQRISLLTLGVTDMAVSAGFYEALGWVRVDTPDGVAAFDLPGQTLALYPKADLARDLGIEPETVKGFSGITLGHNVRDAADVARILGRAEAAGGSILRPAGDVFWGGHTGYFADPDGHVWEVAHNPGAPLGADGSFQWNGA